MVSRQYLSTYTSVHVVLVLLLVVVVVYPWMLCLDGELATRTRTYGCADVLTDYYYP